MKSFFIISFLFVVNNVFSQDNNVNWDDIIQKNKIFYKKNEKEPFNGRVFGSKSGIMKYGVKSGIWENFYKTNITESIGLYVDGKKMKFGGISIKRAIFNQKYIILII